MTAMSAERSTIRMDASGAAAPPDQLNAAVAANAVGFQGGIACFQPSSGFYVDASATTGLVAVGRWQKDFSNTGGANGAVNVNVDQGTLKYASGTGVDLITQADAGSIAYIMDDQTLGLTNGGGTRSPAGIITQVDADGSVWCAMSLQIAGLLMAVLGLSPANMTSRAVVTSLAAYAGTTTGTLTASANGAFGTQDGITTLAVGDTVFIPEGTTNLTAASDAGPYVIAALGATGAKWQLVRPSWWATGASIPTGAIKIGPEGTFWFGTEWKSFAVKGSQVIDTSAPKLYPGRVAFQITLVAGTKTISGQTGVPVSSCWPSMLTST